MAEKERFRVSIKTCNRVISLCFTWSFTDSARAAQFSSIVIDATTGRTLHQYRANQQRYPASLAKMMTLYMMFEEIEQGRMKPDTKIRVSRQAASTSHRANWACAIAQPSARATPCMR